MSFKDIDPWDIPLADNEARCVGCNARYTRPNIHDIGFCHSCIREEVSAHIRHYTESVDRAAHSISKIPKDPTSARVRGGSEG